MYDFFVVIYSIPLNSSYRTLSLGDLKFGCSGGTGNIPTIFGNTFVKWVSPVNRTESAKTNVTVRHTGGNIIPRDEK